MALRKNSVEGYANGASVTAGTSGGGSGNAFDSIAGTGVPVASTLWAAHGTKSIRYNFATGIIGATAYAGMNSQSMAARVYCKFGALPDTAQDLLNIRSASANAAKLQITALDHFAVTNSAGTVIKTFSPTNLDTTTTYRLELAAIAGATTSSGRIIAGIYAGDSTTPLEALYDSGATVNTGTANLTEVRYGKNSGTGALDIFMDDYAVNDGTSTFIGPYTATNSIYGPYVWNGTSWVQHIPYVWSGSAWIAYTAS